MNEPRPSCEIHARYSRGCSECHRTEIDAFRAEVAAALRELRHEMIADLNNLTYHDEFRRGRGIAAGGLDAVITNLGLAPGKDEANG